VFKIYFFKKHKCDYFIKTKRVKQKYRENGILENSNTAEFGDLSSELDNFRAIF